MKEVRQVTATVVDEVWLVTTSEHPTARLFMQWDNAVPVIREALLKGARVSLELAPVIGIPTR